ncbi:hypothetical protein HY484_01430 [Candidatus Woesearchaeota archaeon]|nr:hypothetical protein [Candidatus Woesearchaeota archaeon]
MADKQIYLDLDTQYRKGSYILFKTGSNYALLSKQQACHFEIYTSFKEKVEQEKIPQLQTFNPVAKEQICGAGLYKIDQNAGTITFFGNSDRFKTKPIGPLEDFCNEITKTTGLQVRINTCQDWWKLWTDEPRS